jgi:hypothetical protein
MARRRRSATCARCGRVFKLCRFNGHHQKYCGDPDCVSERRRERQRRHYNSKYRDDTAFREAEQDRCREGARRRRAGVVSGTIVGPASVLPSVDLALVTAGLVSQLTDSRDPLAVAESTRSFERRGLELAVGGGSARASPVL